MPEEKVTILKRALMTEEEIAGKIKENWFSSVFHLSEIESRSLADLMIIGNDGRVALLEIKTSRYLKENLKNVSLTAEKAERLTEAGKRFGVPVYVVFRFPEGDYWIELNKRRKHATRMVYQPFTGKKEKTRLILLPPDEFRPMEECPAYFAGGAL